ncbi:hypothetical protein HPB50_007851 [Hyalomma asiaticum]|uniref:Uncharacterized protein n=1 Tax=Hyalomma asiaticum TaxID=266040 RepID=A0ACB7RUV0_HYAAI|nr:hypothetical protein HPB50_007851 [Hyalomma asiaticum]
MRWNTSASTTGDLTPAWISSEFQYLWRIIHSEKFKVDFASVNASWCENTARSLKRYPQVGPLANTYLKFDKPRDAPGQSAALPKTESFSNEIPTVEKITTELSKRMELESLKRCTVRRLLAEIGFKHGKRSRNSLLVDRDDITDWPDRYLSEVECYREECQKIF